MHKITGGEPLYGWGVYDLAFQRSLLDAPTLLGVRAFCINGLEIPLKNPPFSVGRY